MDGVYLAQHWPLKENRPVFLSPCLLHLTEVCGSLCQLVA